jgi:putative acetyltransferase
MSAYSFRDALPGDAAAVQEVVGTVLREYGMELDLADKDRDLAGIPASYTSGGGAFRVLVDGAGRVVGCGGLFPLGGSRGEVRKMYLLPEARGQGLGRALLRQLVDIARSAGLQRLTLETKSVLREAIALYQAFGFTEIAHPHTTSRCDRTFALDLEPGATGSS